MTACLLKGGVDLIYRGSSGSTPGVSEEVFRRPIPGLELCGLTVSDTHRRLRSASRHGDDHKQLSMRDEIKTAAEIETFAIYSENRNISDH